MGYNVCNQEQSFLFSFSIQQIERCTQGFVKGKAFYFRYPYFYFWHWESTSTASQINKEIKFLSFYKTLAKTLHPPNHYQPLVLTLPPPRNWDVSHINLVSKDTNSAYILMTSEAHCHFELYFYVIMGRDQQK